MADAAGYNTAMSKRALLVIDVQNEYFTGKLPVTYPAGSLMNILRVMDAARAAGVLTAVIQHAAPQPDSEVFRRGSREWELLSEVADRPRDILIAKSRPGAFTATNLESWLRKSGADTIVVCGYMTQMCCDTTARQAVHLGFNVEFLSDATGTLAFENEAGKVTAEELHRATLVTQQMRFARVISTAQWLTLLSKAAGGTSR